IRANVAFRHEPAPAAETMIPTLSLRLGQVAGSIRREHLAAVAVLGDVARAAVRASQQKGHKACRECQQSCRPAASGTNQSANRIAERVARSNKCPPRWWPNL